MKLDEGPPEPQFPKTPPNLRDDLDGMYTDARDLEEDTSVRSQSSSDSFKSALGVLEATPGFGTRMSSESIRAQAGDMEMLQHDRNVESRPISVQEGIDLVDMICDAYRILDLVSEQGSGGLGEHSSCVSAGINSENLISCSGQDCAYNESTTTASLRRISGQGFAIEQQII